MSMWDWVTAMWKGGAAATSSDGGGTLAGNARVDRFREAWEAYYGRMAKPLKVKPGQTDDNVTLNYAGAIADKGVSFLFGGEVEFVVADLTPAPSPGAKNAPREGSSQAQGWLNECWRRNRKMSLLSNVALNGAVCGHAFVKLVHPAAATAPYPRLVVLDPAAVDVVTADDDVEQVRQYTITWARGEDTVRQVIEPTAPPADTTSPPADPTSPPAPLQPDGWRGESSLWVIRDEVLIGGKWVMERETAWEHPWPPLVHCQNLPAPNEFWGKADMSEDILRLNHAINFSRSNLNRILKYHAHPRTWGSGFAAKELQMSVDEVVCLPRDATLQNLEMTSDLASSRDFARDLEIGIHEISRVPEIAMGKMEGLRDVSGVALKVLYAPLIDKTETKRRLYGEMLEALCQRLLELGGFAAGQAVDVGWPEMLPGDPMAERQVALLDEQLGASKQTVLARLGYDAAAEMAQGEAAGAQMGEQMLTAFDRNQ